MACNLGQWEWIGEGMSLPAMVGTPARASRGFRGLGEARARSPCLNLEEEEGDGGRSLEKLLVQGRR